MPAVTNHAAVSIALAEEERLKHRCLPYSQRVIATCKARQDEQCIEANVRAFAAMLNVMTGRGM